jgi:hypothetical protein
LATKEVAVASRQLSSKHFSFTRKCLTKTDMIVAPTLLFFVSPIEDKAEGHHFDTIEVIDAESQAVLNTLTEHDFQDAFKNDREAGKCVYVQKGTASRMMVASSNKVIF